MDKSVRVNAFPYWIAILVIIDIALIAIGVMRT